MHDNENKSVEETKGKLNWQLIAIITSLIALISLFGAWYMNNERLFLQIESQQLKIEVQNLEEEIKILHNSIAQQNEIALNTNVQEENQEEVKAEAGETPNETASESDQDTDHENASEPENEYSSYEVQPGDTLSGIAISLYGSEQYASQIAELNGLTDQSILQVGQTLKVLKPEQLN